MGWDKWDTRFCYGLLLFVAVLAIYGIAFATCKQPAPVIGGNRCLECDTSGCKPVACEPVEPVEGAAL